MEKIYFEKINGNNNFLQDKASPEKSDCKIEKSVQGCHKRAFSHSHKSQCSRHRCREEMNTQKNKCLNQMNSKRLWLLSSKGRARFPTNVKGLWRASRKSLMREYLLSFENARWFSVCVSAFFPCFIFGCVCFLFTSLRPHLNQLKAKIKKKRKDMKNNNFSLKLKFCYDTLEIYRNSDFFFSISHTSLATSGFLFAMAALVWLTRFIFVYVCVCFFLIFFQI